MIAAMSLLGVLLLGTDPRAESTAPPRRRAATLSDGRFDSGKDAPASARPPGRAGMQSASSSSEEAPVPALGDRDRDRILRLQSALREIVHSGFGRLKVGLRVIEAKSGRLVFGRAATALMDPASNQKVLATTAALVRLGGDWKFRTVVYGVPPDADGIVQGDVFLRGSGDPTLAGRDLDALASGLVARGVTHVTGGVVADPRTTGGDSLLLPAFVAAGEEPPSSPLSVDRGFLAVRVHPTEVGAPALLILEHPVPTATGPSGPPADFMISNRTRTSEGGQRRLTVEVSAVNGVIRIDVVGRIGVDNPGVYYRRRIDDDALASAILFRAALTGAGISVDERAAVGALVPGAEQEKLAEHDSEPLGLLLRQINKSSDNYEAERLLEAVGAAVLGGAPTTEKGIAVLRDVIGEFGLDPRSYVARNGSGLGHANRITARAMTELLRALYLDPRVGPELVQSLSVGGVDGTTRNRFRGTRAARQVRAKTGTLSGKSCLSGLVGDGDEVMIFSIMVQGLRTRAALAGVRAAQVAAVSMMMRYVQERGGVHARFPSPRSLYAGPSGTDYETEGELEPEGDMPDDDSPVDSKALLSLTQSQSLSGSSVTDRAAAEGGPLAWSGRVGVGGAGSLAGGDAAPGARVFLDVGRRGLGVETTFYGTNFHSLAGPGSGSTEWTRLAGMAGPRYHLSARSVALDLRGAIAIGWLWVHGHNYFTNSTSRTWAVGAGVGARVSFNRVGISPWLGFDAIGWPGRHVIEVMGVPETLALPSLDLLLSAGASFPLW